MEIPMKTKTLTILTLDTILMINPTPASQKTARHHYLKKLYIQMQKKNTMNDE